MNKIQLLFAGYDEEPLDKLYNSLPDGQNVSNVATVNQNEGTSSRYPGYTITNPKAKQFFSNLTGTDPSVSTDNQLPAFLKSVSAPNKIGANQGSINDPLMSAYGDVTNEDIYPDKTSAIAGYGSTPHWGTYALYDTGVRFPFGIYYKNKKALQDMALAAMKAKQTEVKPFDFPDVKAAPQFQEAIGQHYADMIGNLGQALQAQGYQMSDIKTNPNAAKIYNNIVASYNGDAQQSIQVNDKANKLIEKLGDPKTTVTKKALAVAKEVAGLNPEDVANYLYHQQATGYQGPGYFAKVNKQLDAMASMTSMMEPYLTHQQEGVQSQFKQSGLPETQYAQFYIDKIFKSHAIDPATGLPSVKEEDLNRRAELNADAIIKEHPSIVGDKGEYYTRQDVVDSFKTMWANTLEEKGIPVYKKENNINIHMPDHTNAAPAFVNDKMKSILGGATYNADPDNYIVPGSNAATLHMKGQPDVVIPLTDHIGLAKAIVEIAGNHADNFGSGVSKAEIINNLNRDESWRSTLQGMTSGKTDVTTQDVSDAKSFSPIKRANWSIGQAGAIPIGDARITSVMGLKGAGTETPFYFDMDAKKDNGQFVPTRGIVIPKEYVDSKNTGFFAKATNIPLSSGDVIVQGTYIPLKNGMYQVGDANGVPQKLTDGAPFTVSGSYVDKMMNSQFDRLNQSTTAKRGTVMTGEAQTNDSKSGAKHYFTFNQEKKEFESPADLRDAKIAYGYLKTDGAGSGMSMKDVLELIKKKDITKHASRWEQAAGNVSQEELFNNIEKKNNAVSSQSQNTGLLSDKGYKAIDAFENSMGTAQGTSMNKGDGYSRSQEQLIKKRIESTIGLGVWNKMPDKLRTQVYSFAFNNGYEKKNWLTGLAQSIHNSTDESRTNLSEQQAISIIKSASPALFEEAYDRYVNKVLPSQYKSIADNNDKSEAFEKSWKHRPKKIAEFYGTGQ